MRLLTSDEMKQVEQNAVKYGLAYQRMMENAGSACVRNIRNIIEENDKPQKRNVVVVCGEGNNGGDGFVIARKLDENGYNVVIILAAGYPKSQEATYMYKLVIDSSITTVWYDADKVKALQTIRNADVVVDAIFGFSFHGSVDDSLAALLDEMTSAPGVKFAIDVPSGVYCDSGYHDQHCFIADYTIAISALKPAHILHPACDCCGDIIIANIRIPEDSFQLVKDSLYTCNKTEIKNLLPVRSSTANKGSFGHVLCICGSRDMVGAAILSASAALRSGGGLVTVAFPKSIYNPLASNITEALMMPLPENEFGTLSADGIDKIKANLNKYDAVVIGCGIGVNEDTKKVLTAVIENSQVPVVIDADGLNILSEDISLIRNRRSDLILTPHPKEMSRLINAPVDLIQSDRAGCARVFAEKFGVYVVLKGANTVVAQPDTRRAYVNATGNNGLSKGGSGDVLAGLMGGMLAQNFAVMDALTSAVYIHGYAADVLSEKMSEISMLPSDVVKELAFCMSDFKK